MEPVVIRSPVRGNWSFMNPPGHHPDAKDFVAVDSNGFPYRPFNLALHIFYRLKVEHIFSWEKEVYSPFSGTVVDVSNNRKDRTSLNILRDLIKGLVLAPRSKNNEINYFFGNYIIIESAEGIFALLAHLKKGSVLVMEKQNVESGDLIAQVGNSGNTIQPHLHFHLMAKNEPDKSIPIPFLFESCQRSRQGSLVGLPNNYESFKV